MNNKLKDALNNVEMTYDELIEIANDIISPIVSSSNSIISDINSNINTLSIDNIRDYILRLQLKAYELVEIKEKSTFKADLAEAIYKEQFAIKFNGLEGTAAAKDKLATVETSSEVLAENLYSLISSLLKTKVDAIHRMIDSLKSVLMSRMQELKLSNTMMSTAYDGESPYNSSTTGNRQILNETYITI